jgi:hypothetical protein
MKAGREGWGGGGRTKRVKQQKYLYICLHKYVYCVYKNILSYKIKYFKSCKVAWAERT